MTRKLPGLLLSTALLTPSWAFALGVGKIEVHSALNQALNAEIELISVGGDELVNLSVNLASAQTFAQAGVDRPGLLEDLKFSVQTRPGGGVVKVTSNRPIREPNLEFLVEFTWSKGRLLREFTLLLDPQTVVTYKPTPAVDQDRALVALSPPPHSVSSKRLVVYTGKTYGPVAYGETLSEIAQRLRPNPSISIRQMMDALLRANPGAFSKPNVDNLLAGKTLRIPRVEPHQSGVTPQPVGQPKPLSPAEQDKVRLVPPETGEEQSNPQTMPVTKTAPQPVQETAVLAIPAPFQIKVDKGGRPSLQISGFDDFRDRVGTLATIETTPSPNAQESMKTPPQQPSPKVASPPALPAPTPEMTAPTIGGFQEAPASIATPPTVEPPEQTPEVATAPPELTPAEATPAVAESQQTSPPISPIQVSSNPEVSQPLPTTPEPVTPPAAQHSSAAQESLFWGTLKALLKEQTMLGLSGSVLVLLAASAYWLIRRRSAEQEDFSDELAVIAANVDQRVTKPTPTPSSPLPTSSINPAEKADLLLAMGNYAEAERILTSVLANHPANTALLAKLLEVHFAARNKEGFLREAQKLRNKLDGQPDSRWTHVLQMGRELCGEHPLFNTQADLEATEPAIADDDAPTLLDEERTAKTGQTEKVLASLDFHLADFAGESPKVSAKVEDKATDIAREPASQLPDEEPITLAEGSPVEAGEITGVNNKALDKELEWRLPDLKSSLPQQSVEEAVEDNVEEQLKGLGFELDDVTTPVWSPKRKVEASLGAAKYTAAESKVEKQGHFEDRPQDLDFEFEITDKPHIDLKPEEDLLTPEDHVETKLDLAVAYLDMGDQEGAQSLLQEVLNEGSSEQKQRARACMARLG
jgi:pilus assembly protein FimV